MIPFDDEDRFDAKATAVIVLIWLAVVVIAEIALFALCCI